MDVADGRRWTRWDTPQHVMTDDTVDTDKSTIWPGMWFDVAPCYDADYYWAFLKGKDYSNPRVSDFFNLHKPEEDMYDRTKVPRMPWYVLSMFSATQFAELPILMAHICPSIQAWRSHANGWTACSRSGTTFRSAVGPIPSPHAADFSNIQFSDDAVPFSPVIIKMELPAENKGFY